MAAVFWALFAWNVAQRLLELRLSRRNAARLAERGFESRESPRAMRLMIALHVAWFLGMLFEHVVFPAGLPLWLLLAGTLLFLAGQALRIWVIRTLGAHWNVGVMHPGNEAPKQSFVVSGPYRHVRHPNYLAVILEIAGLPLAGDAPVSAAVFTALNGLVLRRRIAVEEELLFERDGYREAMAQKPRLVPSLRASCFPSP